MPLVVYVDRLDAKSSALYVSPQITLLLGYSQEEWIADPDLFIRSVHPDDRDRVLADVAERNAYGAIPQDDYRMIDRDGRVVRVCDQEIVVNDAAGTPVAAQGYMQDVTARTYDSMRLELLVGILSLAAEEHTPEEIVSRAARLLVSVLGDVSVTFVEIGPDRKLSARYSTELNGPVVDTLSIPGYLERLESGPIVLDDVRTVDWLADVADALERQQIGSAVDVPLRRDGRTVAVLWFNTREPRRWDPHEVTVLSEVAEQLAIVLDGSEARARRLAAEKDLRSRDAILEAVSRSAEHFLTHPDLDDAMEELMRVLGEATGASRAYVFENSAGDGPLPLASRRSHWSANGWDNQVDDPRLGHMRPSPHFPRWAELLGRGDVVRDHVRCLPPDERDPIMLLDALSILAVPVFVDNRWWGFIGFDDCESERDWSSAETDALRAAAGLVAAAIGRERAERDLRRRDSILEAVSHGASQLVAAADWRDVAPHFLQKLGEASGVGRSYLFENGVREDGRLITHQRFEWAAPGVTPELDNQVMQGMCFEDVGLERLAAMNARNEPFTGRVKDMPAAERSFFEAQGIKTLITVPVFVGGEWWGIIGFDDCATEREWSAAETDALRTAATLVAAAIERERAEATLREHEQKLRAVFDTALDAIFITNDDRRYVDVNPAGCELIGVSRSDLIGRRVDEFLPPERLEHVVAIWDEYIQAGPVREEWETMRPDGTVIISEASARPNFVPGLHIAFLRDITDKKRLESELLNAQKLESLGRLAGGVAHDFNNLLTGITGYATLLLERTNDDPQLRRDLGEIKRAADRAAELTKQLLAFGRRQMLEPRPLDLNAVLAETGGLLRRLLRDNVELEFLPASELGIVHADPGQIERVIVNLAVNAGNAMPHGGRLTIETRDAAEGSVELIVSDTGVGMDDETLSQIFEPFFTTRDEGVGLGLASVYGIVHQSGGEVTVESTPGAGSVFTVRLPSVLEPAAELAPASAPDARPGSETILLVEDERVVRDLTRRVLERQGYTVLACGDGEEAVTLAERDDRKIHLLLTDVVMPGLRGYEVARQVATTRPEIKILYMSGYAEEALIDRPALAGCALIEKPFAVDALARRVRETLEAA